MKDWVSLNAVDCMIFLVKEETKKLDCFGYKRHLC